MEGKVKGRIKKGQLTMAVTKCASKNTLRRRNNNEGEKGLKHGNEETLTRACRKRSRQKASTKKLAQKRKTDPRMGGNGELPKSPGER